jgi:hypothetical protein
MKLIRFCNLQVRTRRKLKKMLGNISEHVRCLLRHLFTQYTAYIEDCAKKFALIILQ